MAKAVRVSFDELAEFLSRCDGDRADTVLALREMILAELPQVHEAIRFHSLCYFKPDRPFGAIGGHVCMISVRHGGIDLGFIHGAFLADPQGLLKGTAKSKRCIRIESSAAARRPALRALIRRAHAYEAAATAPRRTKSAQRRRAKMPG